MRLVIALIVAGALGTLARYWLDGVISAHTSFPTARQSLRMMVHDHPPPLRVLPHSSPHSRRMGSSLLATRVR